MFKRKSTQQIKNKVKFQVQKEYNEILLKQKLENENLRQEEEKIYNQKIREQRNMHDIATQKLHDDLIIQHNEKIKDVIKEKDIIIRQTRIEIEKQKKIIRDNQAAWGHITGVLPRLSNLTSVFRIDSEAISLRTADTFSFFAKYHDECASLTEAVDKIAPEVEKLLHLNKND